VLAAGSGPGGLVRASQPDIAWRRAPTEERRRERADGQAL